MRIAFVSANRERLPDEVVPVGLLYVMASTPAHHETVLWDLCFEEAPQDFLGARLREFQPDVVALGLRNLQNSDYSGSMDNLSYFASLVETVRANTAAPLVLGGGGFSVIARGMMQRLRPDYGVLGEGERPFAQLLEALESRVTGAERDAQLSAIGSLHHWREGQLVSNPPARDFVVLDALPPPDRRHVDPRHYQRVGIDSVQTKRGCPMQCTYCTYPLIEGNRGRLRDPDAVVDEMLRALEVQPDIKHFFVVDSTFNLPTRHAKAVCEAMVRRGLRTPWTCYANPMGFDAELAELMARAGCAGMEVGSDSGCDDVLLRLRKGFTTARIREFHRLAADAGLRDCHTFVLGSLGETLDHVRRSLDFIVDLDPYAAILMAWTDDDEAMDPELRKQRTAFRAQILELLREAQGAFPRWIIPPLQVNFDPRLFRWLRGKGLHGPLWQHIRMLPPEPAPARVA